MTPAEREVLRRAAARPGALLTEVAEDHDQAYALVSLVRSGAVAITRDTPPRLAGVNTVLLDADPPRVAGVNLALLDWAGPTFPPKSVRAARKLAG